MVTGSAYGINTSIDVTGLLNTPPNPAYPNITLTREVVETTPVEVTITDSSADLNLRGGGTVHIEKDPLSATFRRSTPIPDAQLIHPLLSPVAVTVAKWLGREAFHCGAFIKDGRVWGVLGDREMGKSSLLAWLDREGMPILADDILVVSENVCFAGPRSLDLREPTVEALGLHDKVELVRNDERMRMRLKPCPMEAELGGWITLGWGELRVTSVTPKEKMAKIAPHAGWLIPHPDPSAMLKLISFPMFEFVRPKDWSQQRASAEALVEALP